MLNHIKEVLAESTGLHSISGETQHFTHWCLVLHGATHRLDILRAYFGNK